MISPTQLTPQYAMWYGQRALNSTWGRRRGSAPPCTFNAVVMFLARPNNQEDNTIMSKSSVEMGMARCNKYRVYTETCINHEVFSSLSEDSVLRNPRLRKVRDGGLPAVGTWLKDGDALACRFDQETRKLLPSYFHAHDR